MSKVGVSLKINVTDIDKQRLFIGKKGKYLDATVFIDLDQFNEYGDSGMITQDVTKEEKQQGVKGNILGNCKVFWKENANNASVQQGGYQNQQNPTYQQAGGFKQQPKPQVQMQEGYAGTPKVNPQEPTIDFDDDIPF